MYLKRLEIQGFKSFPEKIKLEFNRGITAVVGPNGSGKSNISDSVRWVLGEQSIKNLRGTKMEDVIFSGTQNRKPLGFAEVSMIIDNTDNRLNVDFSEVTITRRVYRSGESDFLINGCSCRLKDIHELFMDTGIGKEGYSIIGQGRIDEILSTKSEDRRMLFEEAAGIVKFKNRKRESEDKLEKEKNNLVRVNDIIKELESQIKPLEIQAEKTKQYLNLSEQLKIVKINIFLKEVENYEVEFKKIQNDLENIEYEIKNKEKQQNRNENESKILKENLCNIEISAEKINCEMAEIRSGSEQMENDIKLSYQEIQFISDDIKRLESDVNKNNQYIFSKKEEIEILNSKLNAFEIKLHTKNNIFIKMQKDFENLNLRMSESEELIGRYNTDIIEKIHITTDIKSNIQRTNSIFEQLKERKQQVNDELIFCKSQLNDKNIHLKALQKNKITIEYNEEKLLCVNEDLNKKNILIEDTIDKLKIKHNELNKNINEDNSRYKILSELENDYEGYYESVKSILKQKNNGNPSFNGICGAVGELIEVPQEYETAIEISLGNAVQNIIVKKEKDAQEAIEYLKKYKKGRATFLPMSSIKPKDIDLFKSNILNEKGVIGIAKNLISYIPEYENIMSSLLGRVIIVDEISNAILVSKKYNYSYKLVTTEGEVINTSGSLTGGSINKKSAGIFSRSREIKELKNNLSKLKINLENINSDISLNEKEKESLNISIDDNKKKIYQYTIDKNDTDNKIEQTNMYINDLSEKTNDLNIESKQLDEQLNESEKILNKYNKELQGLTKEINDIQNNLDKYQNSIQSDRSVKDTKNKELIDIRISINEIEHIMNSIKSEVLRISCEIEHINTEIKTFLIDIERNKIKEKIKISTINDLKQEIVKLKDNYDFMKEKYNNLNAKKSSINIDIKNIEDNVKSLYEALSLLKNEVTKLQIKKEQIEVNKSQLYDMMWEEYEVTYVSAKDYKNLEYSILQIKKEEKSLKLKIKELGNININAVEEYKTVKERYEFLSSQREDIINAEKNLKNIIFELSQMMENQFREQFKIISDNFNKVFIEMFGGGTAHLRLSEENDILNSGIEIIAQPPGKNIQSMLLMSGGERALTAISLLFAILIMKPSPFCILDEIEAALDDANVKRYSDFLRKFSAETQFILITHRKGTMEAADILYGVTMQEQGVSKLVSVKFANEEAI